MPMSNKLGAEFIGTFWLVLGGCGSAVLAATFPETGIGFVGVSLAFGLTVLSGDLSAKFPIILLELVIGGLDALQPATYLLQVTLRLNTRTKKT